jgi:thymidylate synthase
LEIIGETIAEAWEKSIRELLNSPNDFIPTEKGGMAKEITNMVIHAKAPDKLPIVSNKYCMPDKFRNHYTSTYLTKYADSDIPYLRIVEKGTGKVDQITLTIDKLRSNWYSRRAVISLWVPEDDYSSNYPPCICMLQALIREGRLTMTAVLRSNDAWLSALPDMVMISSLQKKIAKHLGVSCGEYVHHAISYHIYDYDYTMAEEAFK